MTDHTHTELMPGCFRCELNVDEMLADSRDILRDALRWFNEREVPDDRFVVLGANVRDQNGQGLTLGHLRLLAAEQ